ncbi:transketolase [Mycoplasma iguanae]|uniref:Transketolase n=1 Tax=Mycoplasma iguanae TaxID=292461 RepID=A0ABY5RBV2_9MOLU|nr:1-deoxy-D-xylulose-5-phosphate synthase N-terminal domain-containing protein [Mycoplasma iguanae]UVD81822.1 transketolase [Mycoplasma iguanae]
MINLEKHEALVSAMRGISLDAINHAKQGHLGMALGATNLIANLVGNVMKFTTKDPKWINRDRFVLSAGHGSLTIYSLYNFLGILNKEDLINHKILNSKTPSHPEMDKLEFVDASTGPLGQGIAMGVGMAIAQQYLAQKFNKKNYRIIDNHIFVVHGDGCIQEGVALEAIQLAGTLKLNKLILIHDYNAMQIDSSSAEVNNIDFQQYFKSQNFNVIIMENDNTQNFLAAIELAKKSDQPTYIQVRTEIAKGTAVANTPKGHNGILSPEATIQYKKALDFKTFEPFEYDESNYQYGAQIIKDKNQKYDQWKELFTEYSNHFPELANELLKLINNQLPLPSFDVSFAKSNLATRDYIPTIMEHIDQNAWNVLGGSADLKAACKVGWNLDFWQGGKNIKYGIREFAMTAINNGINLYSNFKTLDATFLVFSDYAKSALRLASLMELTNIHIYTHDSYQVGGDGPTHQPIEQITGLRSIPNFKVVRPCDESEMLLAFKKAFSSKKEQYAIIGCRQPLKSYNLAKNNLEAAYHIIENDHFQLTLLASGSEVELAEKVLNILKSENILAQLISVPILNDLVNDEVLIKKLKIDQKPIFAIEASNDSMWYKLATYNKFNGHFSDTFGASADGQIVYELHGFEANQIAQKILKWLAKIQ